MDCKALGQRSEGVGCRMYFLTRISTFYLQIHHQCIYTPSINGQDGFAHCRCPRTWKRRGCTTCTDRCGIHSCRHCCWITGSKDDGSLSRSQRWWCGRWKPCCPCAISWGSRPCYHYQSWHSSHWGSAGAPDIRNICKECHLE